jgi:hypothetical protein
MHATSRLVFDPTGPDDGSNVGAYVRAGDDGTQIGSQNINSDDWLNTAAALFDGSGNAISSTTGYLDVNIASSTGLGIYDEDSAHTTEDPGQFVLSVRVDDLTSVPASVLAGTEGDYQAFISGPNGEMLIGANQLDIDDLNATDDAVQAWTFDGTGNAIGSTTGALDVYLTNPIGEIDIDDDLANTAIENTATPFSTSAVNIVTSALANRKWVALANEGNKSGYFGKTGVTVANGYPLHPGEKQIWRIGPTPVPQIIGDTGASSEDLRVMELS